MKRSLTMFVALVGISGSTSACTNARQAATGRLSSAVTDGVPATDYPEAVQITGTDSSGTQMTCTGTVVAPDRVLTAGHCLDGMESWTVTAPNADDQTSTSDVAATFNYQGSRDADGHSFVQYSGNDVGVIHLDTPIILDEYPTFAKLPPADGTAVVNIGRTQNGEDDGTLYVAPGEVSGGASLEGSNTPHQYTTTLGVYHGDSGGAVMIEGTHEIVGVNSIVTTDSSEAIARTDQAWDWLNDQNSGVGTGNQGAGVPEEDRVSSSNDDAATSSDGNASDDPNKTDPNDPNASNGSSDGTDNTTDNGANESDDANTDNSNTGSTDNSNTDSNNDNVTDDSVADNTDNSTADNTDDSDPDNGNASASGDGTELRIKHHAARHHHAPRRRHAPRRHHAHRRHTVNIAHGQFLVLRRAGRK